MRIEEAYMSLTSFDLWVRIMEIRTRIMEARDAKMQNARILIISSPIDRGVKILAQANATGESHILCFNEELGGMAREYIQHYRLENLEICVEPFFSIPFDGNHFDAIFANCFFDFCQEMQYQSILNEMHRALKCGGLLFSVYMDMPSDRMSRTWVRLFERFPSISRGCHPVDIRPHLSRWNFTMKKETTIRKFGFPAKYLIAEK